MRFKELSLVKEAGEPKNPSRRGFLKTVAGTAAAAALPGGIANLAKAPGIAAAAPAAAKVSNLGLLFNAAMSHGLDQGWLGHAFSGDVKDPEPDPELLKPQGDEGQMPWGEYYEVRVTPSGKEYLLTGGPYGESGIFTYIKDGQARNLEIAWERDGYGEVVSSDDEKDADIYYDFSDIKSVDDETFGELVDALINGSLPAEMQQVDNPQDTPIDTTPMDLARLAGITKKASDQFSKFSQFSKPSSQTTPSVSQPQAPSLPAPSNDNDDLLRDLNKVDQDLEKQKIKRKDINESVNNFEKVYGAIKDLLPIAMAELKLTGLPKIHIKKTLDNNGQPSFGSFNGTDITLAVSDRHPVDICRTLAHELTHYQQGNDNKLNHESGRTGSPEENEANSVAGIIMRKFSQKHPEYMKHED